MTQSHSELGSKKLRLEARDADNLRDISYKKINYKEITEEVTLHATAIHDGRERRLMSLLKWFTYFEKDLIFMIYFSKYCISKWNQQFKSF